MRIIGGQSKRRSLKAPTAAQGVRPILARIRKSLFDILRLRVPESRFLDLYAGSGMVGIEALSRGATAATFVDKNPQCLRIIRENLVTLGMLGRSQLVRADIAKSLAGCGGPFDLIFMGPPYHDENWKPFFLTVPTLKAIAQGNLLKADGWVIGQHHVKEPVVAPEGWDMFRRETYGDTYLSFFKMKAVAPIVIKYGGSLLDDLSHRTEFLRDVAALSAKQPVVLVHGGGKEITRQMEKAGLEARFVNGRRFTDEATMGVVETALSGLNADIVRELRGLGAQAVGYSGRTQHLLEATAVEELGRVGLPAKVDAKALAARIHETPLPVFYSVAEDVSCQPLNINADDFALAVAVSLKASRLVFLTDTGGILDEQQKKISELCPRDVEALIDKQVISGGMSVKARACVQALKDGVGAVDIVKGIGHLINPEQQAPEGTVFIHGR